MTSWNKAGQKTADTQIQDQGPEAGRCLWGGGQVSSGRQTCSSWGLPGDPGWVSMPPTMGPVHCDCVTSISGARLPWAPSPQVNLVSSVQVRGQQDLGGLGMGVMASKEVGCVFVEKKQQHGSHAAGTWISGASAPQSPCPWGVSLLQHCLGLRLFPGVRAAPPCPEQGRVLVQWGPALASARAPGGEPAEA